jgi:hypothetical protein
MNEKTQPSERITYVVDIMNKNLMSMDASNGAFELVRKCQKKIVTL